MMYVHSTNVGHVYMYLQQAYMHTSRTCVEMVRREELEEQEEEGEQEEDQEEQE